MGIKEIKSFIYGTIYDFQTIEYLQEYGRIKETVPMMEQILERIRSFRHMNAGSDELKGIFHEAFWDKVFLERSKMRDLSIKIKELSQHKEISEKDLEGIEYQRFIGAVRSWAYENIHQLRQIIKSPMRKKIELAIVVLSALVLGLCVASIVFVRLFLQNWGLSGDFYEGQNFEKHISTGYNMTINFRNNLEMNQALPQGHFSARWQGFLAAPQEGTYTFFVKVEDGARLFIDGQILIDQWQDNKSAEFRKKIFLSKGEHWLCLEYYNNSNQPVLELSWALGDGKRGIIPAWYLRSKGDLFADNNGLRTKVLIFDPKDIESGSGWIQTLHNNNIHWPVKDHLLANNPKGLVSVVKYFVIPQKGRYLVTIFHASAVDYVDAHVKISSIIPLQIHMQTWSPYPIFGQDSYVCEFPAGKNSIYILGEGNPKRRYLGLNSISLKAF